MGNRVLGPNSILLIPKDIQYRLGAGKDGARFINVRPGPADYQPVGKPVVTSEQIYGQSATIP